MRPNCKYENDLVNPNSKIPGKKQSIAINPWSDRLHSLCPLAISILWVAGVALFRGHELKPTEWLILVLGGFALHVISRLTWSRRPLPPLPEGARAVRLSALVAMIVAVMASVVGGVLEFAAQGYFPSDVPWGLRMLWHAACAFGATYCAFLQRLLRVMPA